VPDVGVLLIAFVFPLELLATVFAFLARDTLGATTLGLFAASWLALGWSDVRAVPGQTNSAVGIFLFGFATAALLLALMSAQAKPFFSVILGIALARMVLSGYYEVGGSKRWFEISGGFALALTALALYGGAALGLEDAEQQERLPLFRRGRAEEAFHGYDAQLERLEAEPGVRQQL
jgi:uncharacterized protein